MARIDSTPGIIILAIKQRLIDQVQLCNNATCSINADPDAVSQSMPGEFHYVISPSPSFNFDPSAFDGGAQRQCSTEWIFAVTVHCQNENDETGSDEVFITSQNLGVFSRIDEVLKALAGHDLQDKDGNEILHNPIFPHTGYFHRPTSREGSVQIGFHLGFDWDLGAVYP